MGGRTKVTMLPNDLDKHKVLDTVNQWIFNCDTKASIVLATLGVFLTIIFSSDIGSFMASTIKASIGEVTVCNVIYLCIMLSGAILLISGIYKLVRVLIPTINLKHKSVMFFGNVASYPSFEDYYEAVNSCDSEEIGSDLLHQIYAASTICNLKFKNQKIGIVLSSLGIAILLFWVLIGFLVYYL